MPSILGAVVEDASATVRNRVAAARALLYADALNLTQEKRDAGPQLAGVLHLTLDDIREAASHIAARGQAIEGTAVPFLAAPTNLPSIPDHP